MPIVLRHIYSLAGNSNHDPIISSHSAGTNGVKPAPGEKVNSEKYSLPVIDLYSVSLENKHLLTADGVHFTPDGYKKLAGKIVETLQEKIPELK